MKIILFLNCFKLQNEPVKTYNMLIYIIFSMYMMNEPVVKKKF